MGAKRDRFRFAPDRQTGFINLTPSRPMSDKEHLQAYLEICLRQYEQMMRDGIWPWTDDSTDFEPMIESESNPEKL